METAVHLSARLKLGFSANKLAFGQSLLNYNMLARIGCLHRIRLKLHFKYYRMCLN